MWFKSGNMFGNSPLLSLRHPCCCVWVKASTGMNAAGIGKLELEGQPCRALWNSFSLVISGAFRWGKITCCYVTQSERLFRNEVLIFQYSFTVYTTLNGNTAGLRARSTPFAKIQYYTTTYITNSRALRNMITSSQLCGSKILRERNIVLNLSTFQSLFCLHHVNYSQVGWTSYVQLFSPPGNIAIDIVDFGPSSLSDILKHGADIFSSFSGYVDHHAL